MGALLKIDEKIILPQLHIIVRHKNIFSIIDDLLGECLQ